MAHFRCEIVDFRLRKVLVLAENLDFCTVVPYCKAREQWPETSCSNVTVAKQFLAPAIWPVTRLTVTPIAPCNSLVDVCCASSCRRPATG